ncbi:hypothetical protein IV102_29470 [bacterium]|nr:hypothetical protein [bacterium]
MPNMWVMRPGDANEVLEAWKAALQLARSPVALVLNRGFRTRTLLPPGPGHFRLGCADPW